MEKYKTLKSLSRIINFIAWLTLISGGIVFIGLIINDSGALSIALSLIAAIFWFIILLSFEKLIQLTLDIRESQVEISTKKSINILEARKSESKNQVKTEKQIFISETKLTDLNLLIAKQKKSFVGSKYKSEIISLLDKLITSKESAISLINTYSAHNNSNLVDDLKKLTSNYAGIKEYLRPFIEVDLLEKEYPHELIG